MRRADYRVLATVIGKSICDCRKDGQDPAPIWLLVEHLDKAMKGQSDTYCSKKFSTAVAKAIADNHPAFEIRPHLEAGADAVHEEAEMANAHLGEEMDTDE